MSLGGYDIVLGVQWLRTLGPVLWDFDKVQMQITHGNKTYCLSSSNVPLDQIQDVTAFQMEKLMQQENSVGAFQLQSEKIEDSSEALSSVQKQELYTFKAV